MKKIYYIILLLSVVGLFYSCEDYNNRNFPDYEEMTRPTSKATYSYELKSADYTTLGDAVKKEVETQIVAEQAKLTAKQNELKLATNASDSLRIKAEINILKPQVEAKVAELKLDSAYVAGMFIKTNKCFNETYAASVYANKFINSKYKFVDVNTSIQLTYKYQSAVDTLLVSEANKYTLTTADYDALGQDINQPGKDNYFSSTVNPDEFLPLLLAVKYPLVPKGSLAMLKYMYYTTSSVLTYELFQYNGSVWIPYSKTEQFVFSDSHEWIYDPTITVEPSKAELLEFMAYLSAHDGQREPLLEGYNDWTENDVLRYVYNPKFPPAEADFTNVRTEFFFGTSYYYLNIDVRIISRTYASDVELMAYFNSIDASALTDTEKNEAKTAYMEKRVKQGLALLLSIKYPNLEPKIKGADQYVKINVQLYDGNRWYWSYKYKCVEKGKFDFVDRTKWK